MEAAAQGEVEQRLVGVALGVDPARRLQNIVDGCIRNAPGDPPRRHLVQVAPPDLAVVRKHEVVGETTPHLPDDPVVEVLGTGLGLALLDRFEVSLEAVELRLGSQMTDTVLERIGYVAVVPADARVPVLLDDVVATDLVEHPVERLLVLREQNVPAGVITREAFDYRRAAQAASDGRLFKDLDVVVFRIEQTGDCEPRDAGTEDADLQCLGE